MPHLRLEQLHDVSGEDIEFEQDLVNTFKEQFDTSVANLEKVLFDTLHLQIFFVTGQLILMTKWCGSVKCTYWIGIYFCSNFIAYNILSALSIGTER